MATSRSATLVSVAALLAITLMATAAYAIDRPFSTSQMVVRPNVDAVVGGTQRPGQTDGGLSKTQIERFRCASSGDPTAVVDLSCNVGTYGQDWAPDNEVAVAVNPADPDHIVAGSNDYFYRFNNATGARQAVVPTGFFTSFDGGETWIDGQIPMRSGNGAGDPAPAFVVAEGTASVAQDTVLMAQLENTAGRGGFFVSQGDVSVSRSTDGGMTWSEPVTVFKGTGTGIGPATGAVFYDKEWLTVDNHAGSPFKGRAYLTTTRFLNASQGAYAESPIYLSYSDDGGLTWSAPREISGRHTSCTYQETGGGTDCDESQFSIPEVAEDGTLHVHYLNFQNEEAWEAEFDFDSQILVQTSTDGGETFDGPVQVAQLEDGLTDMPYSVIGRQTIWGHQIRWTPAGNITADPANPDHLTVVWSDRGTPNTGAPEDCVFEVPTAPDYDPCDAGPGSDTNVYMAASTDGGANWGSRTLIDAAGGRHQWFPWADQLSDGTLVVAWDEDDEAPGDGAIPANDTFHHVLWQNGGGKESLGAAEHVDVSATHWAGQYVPREVWPRVCGPLGYNDPGTSPLDEGKDCNVFHGDYTGLQVDAIDRIHVTWTGLNAFVTSPQIDPYTGAEHDGYRQDAMYARR